MKQDFNIAVFGTFGNPNGFTQSIYSPHKNVQLNIEPKTFDIKTNAIQLFDKTQMWALRKEVSHGQKVISYAVYTYAQEVGSTRGGTFVGSALLGINTIIEVKESIKALGDFHKKLIKNPQNIQAGDIQVKHSNDFKVEGFKEFTGLEQKMHPIEDVRFAITEKALLVYDKDLYTHLTTYFEQGLQLLSLYDTIYFTHNKEIADFTHSKGLIPVMEREQLKALQAKIEQQKKKEVEQIFHQVKKWSQEITQYHQDNKAKLEENRRIHQENTEKLTVLENENNKLVENINAKNEEIRMLFSRLQGEKLSYSEIEKAKQQITELQQEVQGNINHNKKLPQLSKLNTPSHKVPKPMREVPALPQQHYPSEPYDGDGHDRPKHKKIKLNKKNIIIIALGLGLFFAIVGGMLVGGLWVYRYFSGTKKTEQPAEVRIYDDKAKVVPVESHQEQDTLSLSPEPNAQLNNAEIEKMIEKQFPKENLPMPIEEVVHRIFKANPNDIGKPYTGKEQAYGELLQKRNSYLFRDGKLVDNQFKDVPSYKK
ncbi:hypothetical protein [Riemerella columbina]|uniref:hypothetical protein n=1 Tax=Riemerella columbina TaxID=103810 RepID=UPI00266F6662|nr:hypothetical protein [Riemerella columbina]WKS94746.1 hypothetical protein NYR17_07370 [Riemerella columbina]